MTVTNQSVKTLQTADGVQTLFTFDFHIQGNSNAEWVAQIDVYEGKTLSVISFVVGGVTPAGGTITMATAPAAGPLTIVSNIVEDQVYSYPVSQPFPSKAVEFSLDKTTLLTHQHHENLARAVALHVTDDGTTDTTLPDYQADKMWIWDPLTKKVSLSGFTSEEVQAAVDGVLGHIGVLDVATAPVLYLSDSEVEVTQPFILPKLSTAARDAIVPLKDGMIIKNIDSNSIENYNGFEWNELSSNPSPVIGSYDLRNADSLSIPVPSYNIVVGIIGVAVYNIQFDYYGRYLFCTTLNGGLHRLTLGRPWTLESIMPLSLQSVILPEGQNLYGLSINRAGTKLITSISTGVMAGYNFGTPFDNLTLSLTSTASANTSDNTGIYIDEVNNYLYLSTFTAFNSIVQGYVISNYDLTTFALDAANVMANNVIATQQIYQPYVNPDRSKLYICNNGGVATISQITLSTPGDLTTAIFDFEFGVISPNTYGMTFKPDGSKMYQKDNSNVIFEYDVRF